ncbi:MAGE family-domain-containing protein [Fusarium flagelliforme]|uniref:MAGE family-domain-containing protein n=1 Tax=Fusarium flagelliforme TaxID=2675880 RepID=UPI001E8D63F2|nr:MAGE family-domain-containing protein [Fusarium flagelliforme]KAH7185416.1 MAGE family-domain-containing protein [Fusarium flagelliforme]
MPPQRRRRPVEAEESEEDARPRQRNRADSEDEQNDHDPSDAEMDGDRTQVQSADEQLAKKLVRYAISCEFSRTVIRRDGIKERVLGNQGRSFRRIFDMAQKQLREYWGMEMRELPVREKVSLQEKRQAMKSNSQPKLGSGSYILTSTLPEAYRSAAILGPSKTPSPDDEATYTAFYTLVITLIYLSGGELSEQKLKRHLQRMNADQNVSMDKTETILKRMERQGYVTKRVERPPLGQDGEHTITWHVGPRGKEEVGLSGVMGMTREVYGDSWNEEMEKKLRSSLNIRDPRQNGDDEEVDAKASRMQE